MNVPAVRGRHGLYAVQLGTEMGSDLTAHEAEARGGDKGFEPACGRVAWLGARMILLDMTVQVAVRPGRHLVPRTVPMAHG
jgi:hypothetical protein